MPNDDDLSIGDDDALEIVSPILLDCEDVIQADDGLTEIGCGEIPTRAAQDPEPGP